MKQFIIQNIITLLCLICIVTTLIFTIKNYKQLKHIMNNDDSTKKSENKTKINKNTKTHYYLFTGIVLLFVLFLFIVPYACKKTNEIKIQQAQLQRLEKIDKYLFKVDEKIFMEDNNFEELIPLHKELVSERENLTKKRKKEE